MKGFIEVVESKSRQRASTICININDISCFFEIYDQENKKHRTSILIKNQRFGFVDADETYEEIKKKIEQAQGENIQSIKCIKAIEDEGKYFALTEISKEQYENLKKTFVGENK